MTIRFQSEPEEKNERQTKAPTGIYSIYTHTARVYHDKKLFLYKDIFQKIIVPGPKLMMV